MLTGKCKIDFEKWYFINDELITNDIKKILLSEFYMLSLSSQYGIYVDFFDSVWIDISGFRRNYEIELEGGYKVIKGSDYGFINRQEARKQAILKANEIYNKK